MLTLAVISAALAAGVAAFMLSMAVPVRSRSLRHRMAELGLDDATEVSSRARRRERRKRLEDLIELIGERVRGTGIDTGELRKKLTQAGFREPSAVVRFLGIRVVLTATLTVGATSVVIAGGFAAPVVLLAVGWGIAAGWFLPTFYLSRRVAARKKEIQLALPDALDLLVICVEAGLGLNQALIRVAREVRHVSRLLSEELALTNLEIRAGIPREEALKNLSERTGAQDVRTLVATMIQTERFGTSIAHSLRVHADTLRLKRKQRAEEAAAKTTIKMVFPLALCVFPALFVVVLAPAVIQIFRALVRL